jgi:amino acid adenylation domain-containing protein
MTTMARTTRLGDLLTRAARTYPDRPAVSDGNRSLTYAELDAAAASLATAMTEAGVRPGDHVGLHLPRGADAVVAIHAALRTGAVVAPLDVADPPARLARMITGAGLAYLVADRDTAEKSAIAVNHLGRVASCWNDVGHGLQMLPTLVPATDEPYVPDGGYLLFTSGSTGWPKGVLLSHENVLHFVRWAVAELQVTPEDRIGSQSAMTFDLSTFDIFGAALSGASLAILPEPLKPFPRDVVTWLADERISIFYAVPSMYVALSSRGGIEAAALPRLRVIAFAGEPFPVGVLQQYVERFGHARLYNLYGPTETNVCTFERVEAGWRAEDGLSIGRALPGLVVEPVDDEGIVVSSGEGEIAVAGPAVFLGYLENGRLRPSTEPIVCREGTVAAYRTGDVGVRATDGRIFLRGRRDHQVKRRGHRIDLQDIESVGHEVPGVESCAAVWRPDTAGDGEIWLFAMPGRDGAAVDAAAVRDGIARMLPPRMRPDHVRVVRQLPLTDRGKIDRGALASRMERERTDEQRR